MSDDQHSSADAAAGTSSMSSPTARELAVAARESSLHLATLPVSTRRQLLNCFASALLAQSSAVLDANARDVAAASASSLSPSLLSRLQLSTEKLSTLHAGLTSLASSPDPLHVTSSHTEVTEGLQLHEVTVSIGVLLVIFESRPDAYPQLVGLSVMTGNAVLMKGGKEARHTLHAMHSLWQQAVRSVADGQQGELDGLVTLLQDRESVASLLQLDDVIDLVIPRGSSAMVRSIQEATHIPVMGHSEGVCHLYVHEDADMQHTGIPLVLDAKCDYPAACNAVECVLVHQSLLSPPAGAPAEPSPFQSLLSALQAAGVTCYAGPALLSLLPAVLPPMPFSFHHEYSSLCLTLEAVPSLSAAISHINRHSSHHTDGIVTASFSSAAATAFTSSVDSACCFVNASTRFADGFRFGLGAEVGISTGRLHARGPVGMQGLVTRKWILSSQAAHGHSVTQHKQGRWQYTHRKGAASRKETEESSSGGSSKSVHQSMGSADGEERKY